MPKRATKSVIAVLVILGLLLVLQTLSFLAGRFLDPRIEQFLAKRLHASVQIDGFNFSFLTGAQIEVLQIRPSADQQLTADGFKLKHIDIDHHLLPLLTGRYCVSAIHIGEMDADVEPSMLKWISQLESNCQGDPALPEVKIRSGQIRLAHELLVKPVRIDQFTFSLIPGSDQQFSGSALFNVGGNTAAIQFSGSESQAVVETDIIVRALDLNMLPVLNADEPMALDLKQMEVQGRLNGSLALTRAAGAKGLSGNFSIIGISVQHPDFPIMISDGSLSFHVTPESILIHDGAFHVAGGNAEIPSGGIHFSESGVERVWINIDARGLQVPAISDMHLPVSVAPRFRPDFKSGRMDADLDYQWTRGAGLNYSADFALKGASAFIPALDDTVRFIDGEISIVSPNRILIKSARGYLSGGRLEAIGSFDYADEEIQRPYLEFHFSDIPQTDQLISLFPPDIQTVIDHIGIKGAHVGGKILLNPENMRLDIGVDAKTAELRDLPFTLDSPAIRIQWTSDSDDVVFRDLKAFKDGSPVEGHGLLKLGDNVNADFTILGRYQPITMEMLQWLGLELNDWRLSGRYDIELRAQDWWPGESPSDSLTNLRAQLELKNVSLTHPEYGPIAQNCFSNLSIGPENALLSNFRGNLCDVGIHGSGVIPINNPGKAATYRFESENLKLEPGFLNQLPFGSALRDLNITGQCEIQAELQSAKGHMIPEAGEVTAILHNVDFMPKETVINGSGTTRFLFTGIGSQDPRIAGSLHLDDISAGAFEGDRLSGTFAYRKKRLRIPEMNISAYGGKISVADFAINTEDMSWQTMASIAHMDFESFVGAFGIAGREAPAGTLRGDIDLKGRGTDFSALIGKAEIKVDRGRLYNLPLLISVFNVLNLQMPRQSPVTDAYGIFRIGEGKIRAEDLLFSGGSVPVHVEGHMELQKGTPIKNQSLDLLVTVVKREGLLDQIPVIDWVKHYTIDYLQRLVSQASVKGTLTEYRVESLSTPITMPIQRMWSLMDRIAPSPPRK